MAGFTDGLLAYWTFDGTANDSSGNGNTLALNGGATFGQGLFGQGLSLDGQSGSYAVEVNTNSAFAFGSNDFTIQVWAEFNTPPGEQTLIEKFNGPSGPGWTFTLPPSDLQFYGTSWQMDAQVAVPTDVWQQFVIERSGSQFSMFWDGNLVATAMFSGDLSASSNPLLIGARDGGQVFPLDGVIDDVAIWDHALSASEIASLWNGGAGQPVGASTINGTNQADTLIGSGDDDFIFGLAGKDNLQGLAGNDYLDGGLGQDRMVGGEGNDTYVVDHTADVVVEDSGNGTDTVLSSNSFTLGQNVEWLTLSGSGNTNGTGNALDNNITGNSGNNTLSGLAGDDLLDGAGGNDRLIGGLGKDSLAGGAGADNFVYSAVADSTPAAFDVIQAFVHGADKIDISAIDANAARNGNQAFGFGGQNSGVVANGVTWYESEGNTFVQADVNGNASADLLIELTGTNLNLTASDFLL